MDMSDDTQVIASSKNGKTSSSSMDSNKIIANTQTSKISSDPIPPFDDTLTMLRPRVTRSKFFKQMRDDLQSNNLTNEPGTDGSAYHKKSLLKLEEQVHLEKGVKPGDNTNKYLDGEGNVLESSKSSNVPLESPKNQHTPKSKSVLEDDILKQNFALSTPLAKMQLPESPDSATVTSKEMSNTGSPTSGAEIFRRLREGQNTPFEYDTELGIVLDKQEEGTEYDDGERDSTMDSGIKLNFNSAVSYKGILEDIDNEREKPHDNVYEKNSSGKIGTDRANYSVVSEINDTTGDFDQPILHGDLSMDGSDDVQVPNSGNNTVTSPLKVDEKIGNNVVQGKATQDGSDKIHHKAFAESIVNLSLPHDTQVVASQDGRLRMDEGGIISDNEDRNESERILVASSPGVTPSVSQQSTQLIAREKSASSTFPKETRFQIEQSLQSTEVISDSGNDKLDNQMYPETLRIQETDEKTQTEVTRIDNNIASSNEKRLAVKISESGDIAMKDTLSILSPSNTQTCNNPSQLDTKQAKKNILNEPAQEGVNIDESDAKAANANIEVREDDNNKNQKKKMPIEVGSPQNADSKIELQQDISHNEVSRQDINSRVNSYIDSCMQTDDLTLDENVEEQNSSKHSLASIPEGILRQEEATEDFDIYSYEPFNSILVTDGTCMNIFKITKAWRAADNTAMFSVNNSSGSWEINQSCILAPAFLRVGDIVKYDGMKKYKFKITGLEYVISTEPSKSEVTCCRGYNTAYIRRYRANGSKGGRHYPALLGREIKVNIERLYLNGSLYGKYPYRIFDDELTFNNFVEDCVKRYGSEYRSKRAKIHNAASGGCFKNCLFLMTMPTGSNDHLSDEQLSKVESFLKDNGATIVSEFEKYIYISKCGHPGSGSYSMTFRSGVKKFNFVALLSTKQIRTLKYLQCLALGWPILSFTFIFDCIDNPEYRERWNSFWMSYLLPAGDSSYRNCTLSLNICPFVENWRKGFGLENQIGLNADLFEGETILVDNSEKSSVDNVGLVFILKSLGFQKVFFLNEEFSYGSIINVATKLRKYSKGPICCYFYSDHKVDYLPDLIKSTNQKQFGGGSSSCLDNLPFLIINWEWLVQSLIAGFAFEPLKVWALKEEYKST